METIKIITLVAGIIFAIDLATLTKMYINNQKLMQDIKRYLTNEKDEKELKMFIERINYDRKNKE